MNTKENFKFASFGTALIACQLLVERYALIASQVSVSIYKGCHCVECSIFHDGTLTITPPSGFDYSSCDEGQYRGTYWTTFSFEY